MEIFGYFSAVFMGLALGMTGGGGSILTVPILVYLFALAPAQAISYSLFIVGSTALLGGILAFRRNEVDLKTGFNFAVPSFIGVYIARHLILPLISDPIFVLGDWVFAKALVIMIVFSGVMLLASISMIKGRKTSTNYENQTTAKKIFLISTRGVLVGLVTGFVGAGGGFLIVPALVVLLGLDMKKAVGTSLMIIASNSLIGFFSELHSQSSVDWKLLFSIVCIAIVGLFVGIKLSSQVSDRNLKKGFGYFVLVMAVFILIDQIQKL